MSKTVGVKTYTAYQDMDVNRVVVLVDSSTTTPMEANYAGPGATQLLGVTVTAAQAGEVISVRPFDYNGTFSIQGAGTISKGNNVYVSVDGKINDELQVAHVGRALTDGLTNETVEVSCFIRDASDHVVPASSVIITDAGGYYTSDNAEGALQEIGADLADNTKTAKQLSKLDTFRAVFTHAVGMDFSGLTNAEGFGGWFGSDGMNDTYLYANESDGLYAEFRTPAGPLTVPWHRGVLGHMPLRHEYNAAHDIGSTLSMRIELGAHVAAGFWAGNAQVQASAHLWDHSGNVDTVTGSAVLTNSDATQVFSLIELPVGYNGVANISTMELFIKFTVTNALAVSNGFYMDYITVEYGANKY